MTKKFFIAAIFLFILVLAVYGLRMVFTKEYTNWSVGVYVGNSPFALHEPEKIKNPVLTIQDVKDIKAEFLADPFLVHENGMWYMFFEVLNKDTNQGDIAYAAGKDVFHWSYGKVVLDEPFHLSYPYVFKWDGVYYMVPESYQANNSVRLYKADIFPTKWVYVKTLIQGRDFVDSSIFYYNDEWWILTSPTSNDKLWLYHANDMMGEWKEHPLSPVVKNNKNFSRPGGRILEYDGKLFRFAQAAEPAYGVMVNAFEITELTTESYEEKEINGNPIIKASGSGWNQYKMHQVDAQKISENEWVASVDGFGEITVFGLGLR
ncbi:hypothetical protein HYW20_01625 [Candidatus Woesearchaeota archaeon]|nr:hypothetical protein [Candidatus Woesearchaeota archaeon]